MAEKAGFAAAAEIAMREREAEAADQGVDLFGEQLRPRGPGRPRGAINKATAEAVELVKLYGISPLQFLFSVFADQRQPMDRRQDAAKAALPYVHRKQPQEVDLNGAAVTLVIGSIGPDQAQELAENGIVLELEADDLTDEENPTKSEA